MIEPAIPASTPRHGELLDAGGRRRKRQRVRVHRRAEVSGPVRIGLWLPLTPLWVLLAPFALLLAPLLTLLPPMLPNNRQAQAVRSAIAVQPYRTAFALGSVLFALSGVVVQVDTPSAHIHIRIL